MDNSYYDVGGICCIDFIKAKLTPDEFKGFLKGNLIKYVGRAGHKSADPTSDYNKAAEYLKWLMNEEGG
jgi:hypothetical protein